MPAIIRILICLALCLPAFAQALPPPCNSGRVFEDRDGDGHWSRGDRPLPGILVSDGLRLVRSNAGGEYSLPWDDGRTTFVIKPAGYAFPTGDDGLPAFWRNQQYHDGPALKFGGVPAASPACRDFALTRAKATRTPLDVLVFADPQAKTAAQVDYYDRDIIAPLVEAAGGRPAAALGLTLGDVANDDLSLYPALKAATARLRTPWLHAAGNHDLDFDASTDEDSLRSFRHAFGPDTFAWEEAQASFILLDDVIYRPGGKPAYIGGLREEQFTWLAAYLDTLPRDRRLVIGAHIPFFDEPGRETFRRADRERLFALLAPFGKVLLLSGHGHVQRHHYHGAADGWNGRAPLHEYNVGAACGGYWGGAADAQGLPDARMADGTPNGYASLRIDDAGDYALRWHAARRGDEALSLHAPKVLRRGHWPGVGLFANVYMGEADTRVEVRIDAGEWQPMPRVDAADPALLAENLLDDLATTLRGYDRLPEAAVSTHLWRFNLPTDLAAGEHVFEVRAFDRWRGEIRASGAYRLVDATE
ncbi:MAG TPA: calcineurin-like phosphoesterase family protein [Arenimonas sp.]|uniref:calcineurin-like phosphoesterase family protein n=1 Tax=Arenimonas sp. TaxID=1872635 RepID=UPI002D80D8DB|nr:calcineurin-like phosphoesterase family protein [Arenimonas sp.]HEU0153799.1 calcineurin-like phosphoesterase family protein [Arenimonas sp.]